MPRNLCSRKDWLWFCGKHEEYANFTGLWDLAAVMARLIELNYCCYEEHYARLQKYRYLIEPWMLDKVVWMALGKTKKGERYSLSKDPSEEFCEASDDDKNFAKLFAKTKERHPDDVKRLEEIAEWLLGVYCDFKYVHNIVFRFEELEKEPKGVLYDTKRFLEVANWLIWNNFSLFEIDQINGITGDRMWTNDEIHRILKFVDYKETDKHFLQVFYWDDTAGEHHFLPSEIFDEKPLCYNKFYPG